MTTTPERNADLARIAAQLETLHVVYVPINRVKPNDYNPNRQASHEFQMLCKSIREDGFTQPIVTLPPDKKGCYTIVDGEHRWKAAQVVGLKEIPCVAIPHETAQARLATMQYNLARGSEDADLALGVLRDLGRLGAAEWAKDALMLSAKEWEVLMSAVPRVEDVDVDKAQQIIDAGLADPVQTLKATPGMAQHVTTDEDGVETVDTAALRAALQDVRVRENLVEAAKGKEERKSTRQDMASQSFRLELLYVGTEAIVVRAVLGFGNMAKKILDMCAEAEG